MEYNEFKLVANEQEQTLATCDFDDVALNIEVVIEEYEERLRAMIERMVSDQNVADDILQNVWINVLTTTSPFEGRSTLFTWLYRIAYNETMQYFKKERIQQSEVDPCHEPGKKRKKLEDYDDIHPGKLAEVNEEREWAYTIIDWLRTQNEDQAEAILMRDIQGYSYEQIAHATHSTVDTVKNRISKGRQRTRSYFKTSKFAA